MQQTRLYNPDRGITYAMRSKEESHDYRYFPDPDLPTLVIDDAWLDRVKSEMPELPAARRARYVAQFALSEYDASVLCAERTVADYFEAAHAEHDSAKGIANWIINEALREWSDLEAPFALPASHLATLVKLVDDDVISGKIAKQVFQEALESGDDPRTIVKAKGLEQITDTSSIEPIIARLIADNPDNVAEFRAGKDKVIGWFVGQVMRETRGKANPQLVNELLQEMLRDD